MNLNQSWKIRLAQISLGAALVVALVVVRGTNANNSPVHSVTDWSHRHLIFSAPKNLIRRFQYSSNARYVQQWVGRNAQRKFDPSASRWRRAQPNAMKGDWSMNMGTNARVGAGVYPAKYSFDVTAANCSNAVAPAQPDFVVYNTGLAGNNTLVAATAQGSFAGVSAVGSTITITNGLNTLVMTPGGTNSNVSPGMGTYVTGTNAVEATNLFTAINIAGNGSFVGVTAISHPGAAVNFQATTAGLGGNSITISSSSAPASNFTWVGTTFGGGATGQASIMGFDNLYVPTCGATPSVYWAYNTGGQSVTSPVISFDGKQVAFVQTAAAIGNLVILKWKASGTDNYNNPTTLVAVTPAQYPACAAPCMTSIPFAVTGNSRADTNSSPFYDYAHDNLYVGDNGGRLRQFTHIFGNSTQAAPAETVVAGQWPVTLTANNITTSPVYDDFNNRAYIADNGGFLYSVLVQSPPVVVKSGRVGFSLGIAESPIVDSVAGTIYVYVSNNSATLPATSNSSAVFQFTAGFIGGSVGTNVTVGNSSGAVRAFAGDFDNTYYSSAGANAGNIYVCGAQPTPPVNTYIPTLWQIPITGTGAMGVPVPGPALGTVVGIACSPVVEVFNPNVGGGTDWIFLSIANNAVTVAPITCPAASGCLMSFDVTSGAAITNATATHAAVTSAGGTSGIIIDNFVQTAGSSQVYFTPLGNQVCTTSGGTGGCAIQASQTGLN